MTTAVPEIPMREQMIQAFLRDLTGRIDISEVEIVRTAPDQLTVIDPEGENHIVEADGE